jgi:hypothetical protein
MFNKTTLIRRFELVPKWNFKINFDFSPISFLSDDFIALNIIELHLEGFKTAIQPKSIDVPGLAFDTETYPLGPYQIKYPTNVVFDDIPIDFYYDTNGNIEKFYSLWQSLMSDFNTGAKYPRSYYEANIKVDILDRRDKPCYTYTFFKCYPVSRDRIQYNYQDQDYVDTFVINFKVNGGYSVDSPII